MASLSLTHSFQASFNRRATTRPVLSSSNPEKPNALTVRERSQSQSQSQIQIQRRVIDLEKLKKREARERKEEVNNKIASKKAISVILRREATKALIEKKRGPTNSKKLLPRTVLEALHDRITALRPDSALKVIDFIQLKIR